MENNQIPVRLFDPERGIVYTINLSSQDAGRCESDIEFAQQMLKYAINAESASAPRNPQVDQNNLEIEESVKTNQEIDEKSTYWAFNEIVALITAYDNHKENFLIAKKRKFVWQDIANEILSNGFEKSAEKCESKWRNLVRTYKNVKDAKKSTGRGASKFQFFDRLNEILGDKPAIKCIHTFGTIEASTSVTEKNAEIKSGEKHGDADDASEGELHNTSTTNMSDYESTSSATGTEIRKQNKRKRTTDEMLKKKYEELVNIKIKYFKNKQEEVLHKNKRKEKQIELKEKMLELEQRKNILLEKYLDKENRSETSE